MDLCTYIARLNIEHYRQKLLIEQDEPTQQRIPTAAEEEAQPPLKARSCSCWFVTAILEHSRLSWGADVAVACAPACFICDCVDT